LITGKTNSARDSASPGLEAAGVATVNPLEDPAWDRRISAFPEATCFHSAGWARVLHESYGYSPCYFVTARAGGFGGMLPVMEVSSRWTGRRGVSLPFTDGCDPLSAPGCDARPLVEAAVQHAGERAWRYVEFRGRGGIPEVAPAGVRYLTHQLELAKDEDFLWAGVDGAARRSVHKARDSGVVISTGRDETAMKQFFRLHCLTRKRHGAPPQPYAFFSNIRRHLMEPGLATVFLASHRGKAVAAAVFMHFGSRAIFKFGASDLASQHLRANNLLMWEAIRRMAADGMRDLHMGRSETDNPGLRRFKLAWGTTENEFIYHRYSPGEGKFVAGQNPQQGWHHAVFRRIPLPVSRLIGSLVYPHMA